MKKLIIITLTIIFSNASLSLAGQFKSKWGFVIGVNPVNVISNYQEPYKRVVCEKFRHKNPNNFANLAVGGLIGSVIGNKLSDTIKMLQLPEFKDVFSLFYVLPTFFNSDLDRGFSIIDYNINEDLVSQEDLKALDEKTFLDVFDGVPQTQIAKSEIENGLDIIAALAEKGGFLKSNGEARRALKENSISVNKEKVAVDYSITSKDLINNKFVLLQRGKKNYFVLQIV